MIDIATIEQYMRTANPIPTLDGVDADELASAVAATHARRAAAMEAPAQPPTSTSTSSPTAPVWRRHRVWVFAAAFVLVLAAVGATPLLLGGDDDQVTDEPPPPIAGGTATVIVSAGTFELPIEDGACTQRDGLISVVARSDEASLIVVGPEQGGMEVGFELSSGELWSRAAAPFVVDGTTMSFSGPAVGPTADETISVRVFCDEIVTGAGDGGPTRFLDEPVVGGDLLLVMHPGSGHGMAADLLAVRADGVGAGVGEGTANHVAWFDGEYRPMHVVTFTATRDNPRRGGPEFCVFWGNGGGCVLDPDEPRTYGVGVGAAEAYGGASGAEAVFTTESGNTVSVLTVDGYARAEWPNKWGKPQTVEFYDTAGNLLVTLDADPTPTGREPDESTTAIDGAWVLVTATVDGAALSLNDRYRVTMMIDGSEIGGQAACNDYSGAVSIDEDPFSVLVLSRTRMACEPDAMEIESAFIEGLSAVANVTRSDEVLSFTGEGVEYTFELLTPVPTAELIGPTWMLDSIIEGGTVTPVTPIADPATLTLNPDGTFTGGTGCRVIAGEYVVSGDTVQFTSWGAEGECGGAIESQDRHVIGVLEGGFTATVDSDRLVLIDEPGDSGLSYCQLSDQEEGTCS